MIHISTLLSYYKRTDVQQAIVAGSEDRELGVFYAKNATYGKRPDILSYPRDVLAFVQQGATSFHISEERWANPLGIVTGMPRKEQDELRSGWDLVIDIDCSWLEYSQVAAHIIVQKFKSMGIECFSIKFSGNHGFHIGIPFEAFPEHTIMEGVQYKTKDLFPEGPRKIAAYLQDEIQQPLGKMLVERFTLDGIKNATGKSHQELITQGKDGPFLDAFKILAIDTVLIASRHLVRAPYSLHEKSGLASIPVHEDELLDFKKESAHPDKTKVAGRPFLDRSVANPNEARLLFEQAFAHKLSTPLRVLGEEVEKHLRRPEIQIPEQALAETVFPPCMQHIKKGLKDGKKRAMFAAVNFLVLAGWDYDKIEEWIIEFSKSSPEPIREVTIKGHIRYHKQNKKRMPPPNCRKFYQDILACHPDSLCERIKNPIQYARRKAFLMNRHEKPKKQQKTE